MANAAAVAPSAAPVKKTGGLPIIADGGIMLFGREIGTIAFAERAPRHYNINQSPNMMKRICLEVKVTATVVGMAIPMPADGPFNMIKNIKYKTSAGQVIKNFSALNITLLSNYESGTVAYNTAPATLPVGLTEFEFNVWVPFEDWTGQYPERTVLNTNQYNDSTIYATWDDLATVWPGWDSANDSIEVDCRVVSYERLPLGKKDELLNRQQMMDNQQKVVIGTPSVLLPENTKVKTLVVITRDDQGDRANGLLERLKVTYNSGSFDVRDLLCTSIQSQNKCYYGVENIAVGVYVIEFDQTHDFKTLLDTTDKNFSKLEFEPVSGAAGTIEILRRKIETPKIKTA